jgi:ectoine hydroxylase-related dioxygenase (phytanoyl-CoA dioxygenase family)
MTDFTAENGATRVVPGSNHYADKLSFSEGQTEPAEMSAGSVLFYTGSLYHGGGANRSSEMRSGLNLTYNLAWLRQEENQYLACPHEIARTLPAPLLRLMGYARGAYALGYVGDLRDPIETLQPAAATTQLGDLDAALTRLREARAS